MKSKENPPPQTEDKEQSREFQIYDNAKKLIKMQLGIELTPIEATRLKYIVKDVVERMERDKEENISHWNRTNPLTEPFARFIQECYGINYQDFDKVIFGQKRKDYIHTPLPKEIVHKYFQKLQRERHYEDGILDEEKNNIFYKESNSHLT